MIDQIIKGAMVLAQLGQQQRGPVGWPQQGRVLDAAGSGEVELDAAGADRAADLLAEKILAGSLDSAGLDAGARDGGLLDRWGDKHVAKKMGRAEAELLIAQEAFKRAQKQAKKRGLGAPALPAASAEGGPVSRELANERILRDSEGNVASFGSQLVLLPVAEVAAGQTATSQVITVTSPFDARYLQISGPSGNSGIEIVLFSFNDDLLAAGVGADAYHPALEIKPWLSGQEGKVYRLEPAHHSVRIALKNGTAGPLRFGAYLDGTKFKTK